MANSRLSMRKIFDVLRLHFECGRNLRDSPERLFMRPTLPTRKSGADIKVMASQYPVSHSAAHTL